jgi:hypothetical protein
LGFLLAFLALAAGYLWYVAAAAKDAAPAPGVENIGSYLAIMPAPERAFQLVTGSSEFIEFHGPLQPKAALPSGPPAYVFDETGSLVDWTSDLGDDPRFRERWHTGTRRELDPQEFHELIQFKRRSD